MKNKVISGTVIAIALVAIAAVLLMQPRTTKTVQTHAQPIPSENIMFAQVKKLSVGSKPACLSGDESLRTAVEKDPPSSPLDQYDLVTAGGIMDIPAGIATDYIHSFDGTTATGHLVYDDPNQKAFVGDLKSFNFTVVRDSSTKKWTRTYFIACQE